MNESAMIQELPFLPAGEIMMAGVKLSPDLPAARRAQVERLSQEHAFPRMGVPIVLVEPLRIRFSLSRNWKEQRELQSCKCLIPLGERGKEEVCKSVNSAYQRISELVEPHRRSRGGSVYQKLFYLKRTGALDTWTLLEERRDELYAPHAQRYADAVRNVESRAPAYVRPQTTLAEAIRHHLAEIRNTMQAAKPDEMIQQLGKIYRQSNIEIYKERLNRFESEVHTSDLESNESYWQAQIYQNYWMFAAQHTVPLPQYRIGADSIPDFLFPTLDGYVDVFEIKAPKADILYEDTTHVGAYRWSHAANSAIGQVAYYLQVIEDDRRTIAERLEQRLKLKFRVIRPRGFVILGRTENFNDYELDALRRLNSTLSRIEVLSYTDLIRRGQSLISIFEEDLE